MRRAGNVISTAAACCRSRKDPSRILVSSYSATSRTTRRQHQAPDLQPSSLGNRPLNAAAAAGMATSARATMNSDSLPVGKGSVQNVEGLGEESPVKAATKLGARVLTLNRPKPLNALNREMIDLMQPLLEGWESSSSCKLIILKGEGRGFCAGGDVKALANAAKDASTRQQAIDFFATEYTLDRYIALMKKPVVALMNGVTMGGGVGISIHAPFRIATEKTIFAMPETDIGLFPDVGANFFLSRMDGQLGTYLGLTGAKLTGYDVFRAGIATHYVPSDRLEALEERLAALEFPEEAPSNTIAGQQLINACIEEYAADADTASSSRSSEFPFPEGAKRKLIDACFDQPRVPKIISALQKVRDAGIELSEWAGKTIKKLEFVSPTSLAVALEAIREGKSHDINQAFEYDLRLASIFCNPELAPDFVEGVSHRLGGDKETQKANQKIRAKWSPANIKDVTQEHIKRTFFSSSSTSKAASLPAPPAGTKPYKVYPHAMFALPSEEIIGRVVKGDVKDSGSFAVTEKEVFEWFEREWNGKSGVMEKVAEVLDRKTKTASDGTLQWK